MSGISVGNGLSIGNGLSAGSGLSAGGGLYSNGFNSPSLNLNFTTGVLDSRITFSRPSNATMYDSTGKLTYAPNNLLTYSEQFDNAAWAKVNASITANSATSPDGTLSADTLIPNTSSVDHLVGGSVGSVQSGVTYTQSVYAKAAGYSWTRMSFGNPAGGGFAFFDVLNGVVGTVSGGTGNIVNVGNGWFRCSFTRTTAAAGVLSSDIYAQSADNQFGWAGNGTSGIYIWGAQLEAVTYQTTPSTYNVTTSAAYYGPRFDYDPVTLAAKGLLIEEARTNQTKYSQDFNNAAWLTFGGATKVGASPVAAPDGTMTAYELSFGSTGGAADVASAVYQALTTLSPSTTYTRSLYVRAKTGTTTVRLTFTDATVTSGSSDITVTSTAWTRITFSAATTTASGPNIAIRNNVAGNSGNVYVWGDQLEAGAFATSYIPTAASSVARSADSASMTGANFSSWYNQSAGTFVSAFIEGGYAGSGQQLFVASDAAGNEQIGVRKVSASPVIQADVISGGVSRVVSQNTNVQSGITASAYQSGSTASAVSGALATVYSVGSQSTTYTSPAPDRLSIGGAAWYSGAWNGWVKSIQYYNKRLPNATLQSLTT